MSAARIEAYAEAFHAIAGVEDPLREVEDELFRVARVLDGNDELMSTLADPHIEPARRQQIVVDLLDGKAQPATVSLVGLVVGNGRVRDLPAIVEAMTRLGAASRETAIAEVRSAVALTDEQTTRLAEALGAALGRTIEIRLVVDPSVQGGLVAQVGDTVIDGTVRRRLEQLRAVL